MLKKQIKYKNIDGQEVIEDHYFHLFKSDVIELEVEYDGGLTAYLTKAMESKDSKTIIETVKTLIRWAYGKRNAEGRFIKEAQQTAEFMGSEAYSEYFWLLCTNTDEQIAFINGIVHQGQVEQMTADLAKLAENPEIKDALADQVKSLPETSAIESKTLTLAEAAELDQDELMSGLRTGRYKLETSQETS